MADAGPEKSEQQPDRDEIFKLIEDLVHGVLSGLPVAAEPMEKLEPTPSSALDKKDREQDIELKGNYAKALLIMMAAQLAIADAVFVVTRGRASNGTSLRAS